MRRLRMQRLGLMSGGGFPPLRDTFTGSSAYSAHTPDLGPAPTIFTGTGTVGSGVLVSTTSGTKLFAAANAAQPNRSFSLDVTIPAGDYAAGLAFRVTDANNGYLLIATKIGAQAYLRLIKLGGLI